MADWAIWVVVAGALFVGELMTLDLILVMLGLGALVGAVLALLGVDVVWQIVAATVAAGGFGLGLRPVARRHLQRGPQLVTGVAALVGEQALVVERVDGLGGRVKVRGEIWSARSYPSSLVLDAGEQARVLRIDGATAIVHRFEL
ncbi:NfeD family protein [Frankia sp. AgPm24]|uniref:NfeD family protein n=1 Tax=Frankia umida TaxID=573489 RepID=A0ABT0K452_9ACTN|nr:MULTISPECIES: NfeD family protein [Frankia]MCK9878103.1 NfeD family protein [Frankia umida]MCK9924339.1 NfeD family protein [Frankia sp. AgPm24]